MPLPSSNRSSWLIAATLLCSSSVALAQNASKAKPAPQQSPQAQTVAQQPVTNPYVEQAQRGGITQCLSRINQITTFVTNASRHQGIVQLPPRAKINQGMINNAIAVNTGNNTSVVSTYFAPGTAPNECNGAYSAVTYWNASCTLVAKNNFATFPAKDSLMQAVAVLDGGPNVRVMLLPAGSGCISIKQEIVY